MPVESFAWIARRPITGLRRWLSRRAHGGALALCTFAVVAFSACGGSGGSSSGPGGLTFRALWQQRAAGGDGGGAQQGGFGPELPASVRTFRVVFASDNGERCCVAVDPGSVPQDPVSGQRLLVLDDLPEGAATILLSGFAEDFAPAPPGVADTCSTVPAEVGKSCDPNRPASPSFESGLQPVSIVAGRQSDAGDVLIPALPFWIDLIPPPGAAISTPAALRFAVVEAADGVDPAAILVAVRDAAGARRELPFQLIPCDDSSSQPCSGGGRLEVSGFMVDAELPQLPAGSAAVELGAAGNTDPVRTARFSYPLTVVPPSPTPTSTATPSSTPTASPSSTPSATSTSTPTPTRTATSTATPTATSTRTSTSTRTPTATPTNTATRTSTATRTPTRTSTATPSPTATFTATATATFTATATPTPTPSHTSSATPSPTATPVLPPGRSVWRGVTSQGQPLSFVIDQGAVVFVTVAYVIEQCGVVASTPVRIEPPAPVVGFDFHVRVLSLGSPGGSISFEMQGRIDNPSTASGTLDLRFVRGLPQTPCEGRESVTWTATRQVAE